MSNRTTALASLGLIIGNAWQLALMTWAAVATDGVLSVLLWVGASAIVLGVLARAYGQPAVKA
jgi:hypothetical protein